MEAFLKDIIKRAGGIALGYFEGEFEIRAKSHHLDVVTDADVAISEFLVREINERYPDHHILSEELADEVNPGAQYEWVIDPIDGTAMFSRGIPLWAVMIAILKDAEVIMSAVYFPVSDQLYFAEKGKGAFLNEKKIQTSRKDSLDFSHAILHRSLSGSVYGDYFERYRVACAKMVLETDVGIANFGCAASGCYLASGAFDFMCSNGGLDWDRLPVYLICKEAGALFTDSDGNEWKRGRQDIVVANPYIHEKVMKLFLP